MTQEDVREVPVLVVGAGPAGLVAAGTLAQAGVAVLLVERRRALSGLPRATVISTRSMELLRSWGLEEEIRAGGVDAQLAGWVSETLALARNGSAFPAGLPSREQSAVVSPTAPAVVPQDHLEPVLLRHLRSLTACRVLVGTEVVRLDNRPGRVGAVLRDSATGRTQVVHARYLIGADGAHSLVRSALGIPMRGPEHLAERLTVLFHAPLWDLLGDLRYVLYAVTTAEGGGDFLPAGRGDRWLYAREWDPRSEQLADYTHERISHFIRLGAGVADLSPRVERIGAFSFAAQIADRFRQGSAFLVGDAAHRVSPRGGTGMNTAVQDGYDLGWKLAWVLRGWAGPELLDSYEAERRPVAEHNVTRSADPNGSVRTVDQELHADLGGRVRHLWLPDATARTSTLDLLGPGLTLFQGPSAAAAADPVEAARTAAHAAARAAAEAAHQSTAPPLTVRRLDAVTARAMGIPHGGSLFARPDGVPVGSWPTASDQLLVTRAMRSFVGGSVQPLSGAPGDTAWQAA